MPNVLKWTETDLTALVHQRGRVSIQIGPAHCALEKACEGGCSAMKEQCGPKPVDDWSHCRKLKSGDMTADPTGRPPSPDPRRCLPVPTRNERSDKSVQIPGPDGRNAFAVGVEAVVPRHGADFAFLLARGIRDASPTITLWALLVGKAGEKQ